MWTKQHRKTYKRSDERYPSDLTDAEWSHLEPLIRRPSPAVVRAALTCAKR